MVAFKEEFIDPELKMIVLELKNNLFEQQYGFERQICSLVNKVTQEVQAIQNNGVERMEVKSIVDLENSKL
jgi:regulator of replication initiation timing